MSSFNNGKAPTIDRAGVDAVNCLTERVQRLIKSRMEAEEHICAERSRIVTESWKATEGENLDIRRAKLFRSVMEYNPIVIRPDELIVGSQTQYVLGASPSVDYNPGIALENIKHDADVSGGSSVRGAVLTDEDRCSLAEDCEYWKGRSVGDTVFRESQEKFPWLDDWGKSGLVNAQKAGNPPGAKSVDYGKVIRLGLEGIIAQAREEIAKLEYNEHPADDYRKENFLKAVIIALEGAIIYARRYSALALEMAAYEKDPVRRAELEKIAEVCQNVPAKPAASFHEAVQAFWFTHLCVNLESAFVAEAPGRIDQYLYPMYCQDVLENGSCTRQDAAELLACVFVKLNEMTAVKPSYDKKNIPGTQLQATTICGVDRDGRDATNELSYMLLEVLAQVNMPQPPIYVRYHAKINREVWMKALEVNVRRGDGNPAFMNDGSRIPSFLDHGIPLEDARDWSAIGCAGSIIQGKATHGGSLGINYINLAKILEYVLNDGREPSTGVQIGLRTGDASQFTSLEQFINAFKKQFDYLITIMARMARITTYMDVSNYHTPYLSALLDDCIKKGRDAREGGVRYPQFLYHIADRGLQNVADSLAAIQKTVFDDKKLTLKQVLDAVSANFEGAEDVRSLLRSAPKYGNDDEYVDDIFDNLSLWLGRRIDSELNPFGGRLWAGRSGAVAHVTFGKVTGALPDGRKAGEPLADGFLSPGQGMDVNGPTAAFNSASRICHMEYSNAALMNMKFERKLFKNKASYANLSAMIESYFQRGGFHIQINILDRETLEAAQANPQEHKNLMVRVAGYSAFFVDLPRGVQDEIMSRTNEVI